MDARLCNGTSPADVELATVLKLTHVHASRYLGLLSGWHW